MQLRTVLFLVAVTATLAYYTGVSESGFEQDGYPGTWNVPPRNASIAYFASKGANIIRLPFLWDRAVTGLGPSSSLLLGPGQYFELYRESAAYALSLGLTVIVDMHNYARYPLPAGFSATQGGAGWDNIIGKDGQATLANFQTVWQQIASVSTFKSNNKVWFGLMNEPTGYKNSDGTFNTNSNSLMPGDAATLANFGIAGVRAAGANNLILVAGTVWTGVHSFLDRTWYSPKTGPGSYQSNGDAFSSGISDSMNNWAVEVHTYLDSQFGGDPTNPCNAYPSGFLPALTQWALGQAVSFPSYNWGTCPGTQGQGCNVFPARSNSIRLFLGEFGFQNTQDCANYAAPVLNYIRQNSVENGGPWLGFSWWAGGPNWGNYGYNIEPDWGATSSGYCNPDTSSCTKTERPLINVVSPYFVGGTGTSTTTNNGGTTTNNGGTTTNNGGTTSNGGTTTNNGGTSAGGTSGGSCSSQLAAYAQCGSQGSVQNCCPSGYYCDTSNVWYYQCLPGSGSGSTTGSSGTTGTTGSSGSTGTTGSSGTSGTSGSTGGTSGSTGSSNCQPKDGQCGGYVGNTAWTGTPCCADPTQSCQPTNQWYSQCKPITNNNNNACIAPSAQCGGTIDNQGTTYKGANWCCSGSCVWQNQYWSACTSSKRAAFDGFNSTRTH